MVSAKHDPGHDEVEVLSQGSVVRSRGAGGTHRYQALEMCPSDRKPLHNLLQKQPAVLGSLQVVGGLLSVGVGIIFAVCLDHMEQSFISLFRMSQMTGALFIVAGVVSNMLYNHPELLSASLMMNCGCLCVAFVTAPLIIVDLTKCNLPEEFLKMEKIELSILVLESCFSAILCIWFVMEKRKSI